MILPVGFVKDWKTSTFNSVIQDFLIAFLCLPDNVSSYIIDQMFTILHGFGVEFHSIALAFFILERIGMRPVAIYMHELDRQASIRHKNCHPEGFPVTIIKNPTWLC